MTIMMSNTTALLVLLLHYTIEVLLIVLELCAFCGSLSASLKKPPVPASTLGSTESLA